MLAGVLSKGNSIGPTGEEILAVGCHSPNAAGALETRPRAFLTRGSGLSPGGIAEHLLYHK